MTVTVINNAGQLNDLLVELPDYEPESFLIEYEGIRFKVSPANAVEFVQDYGRDTYSQSATSGAKSLNALREFAYYTGDVVREVQ